MINKRFIIHYQKIAGLRQALIFIGMSRFVTADQLVEYLAVNFNQDQIKALLHYLIKNRLIAETAIPIKNPKSKVVIYLTLAGMEILRTISKFSARYATAGRPNEKQLANVKKHLLIAESFLFWNRKFEIDAIYLNKHLSKKEKLPEQIKKALEFAGDAVIRECDYMVIGYERSQNKIEVEFCRIATGESPDKLLTASDWIVWFAASASQATKLNEAFGQTISALDPLGINRWEELSLYAASLFSDKRNNGYLAPLNRTDKFIMQCLKRSKLTLCLADLQMFFRSGQSDSDNLRKRISLSLTKLSKKGLINWKPGKVRPGYRRGRAARYYYLPENNHYFAGKCFQRHIILSYHCRRQLAEGWRIVSFDPATPALTMKRDLDCRTFISDYADGERDKTVDSTVRTFDEYNVQQKYPVQLVIVDYPRYFKLKKALGERRCFNHCADFDEYESS